MVRTVSTDYNAKPGEGRYVVQEEHKDGYVILSRHATLAEAKAALKRYAAADARRAR